MNRIYTANIVLFTLLMWITHSVTAAEVQTITFFHHDANGSVVAATNEAGEEIWRKNYTPYGKQQAGSDTTESIAYTGHVHDKNLGLTYMKARYYDPEAGRFVGPDTVGVLESVETNPQMFNRYAYANNNPFSFIDPDGRAPKGRGDGSGASAAGALIGCMIGNCNPRLSRTMAATAAKDGNYNIAGSIALNGGMKSKDFVSMVDKVQNRKGTKGSKKATDLTKRPSSFRKKTVQDAWDQANPGSKAGSKSCPTCGKDLDVAPGQGRRDWDVDHQPPWSKRDHSGLDRKGVLDDFNRGARLECPSCNRSRGAKPAK